MSLRPVDLQVLVPRAGDVLKKTGLGIRPDAQQDEFSERVQQRNMEAAKQVEKTQEARHNAIRGDRERAKEQGGKQKQPKPKNAKKESEQKKEPLNEYGSKYYFKV